MYIWPSLPRTKTTRVPLACWAATGIEETTPPRLTQSPQAPPLLTSVFTITWPLLLRSNAARRPSAMLTTVGGAG